MPRYSNDTLLQKAIEPALNDRLSFLDAVSNDPEAVEHTKLEIAAITALRSRALAAMSDAQRHAAMLAFLFADQWESSYADSKPGKKYEQKSRAEAARYREVRLSLWGPSALEVAVGNATPVDVRVILTRREIA